MNEIVEKFRKIKDLGYVKSHRSHNTGIGKTFEDLLGVVENNIAAPDFLGYEVKSHRANNSSYVTLFTLAPTNPKSGANAFLKDSFGTPYEDTPNIKKLHVSMYTNKFSNNGEHFSFGLIDDPENEIVKIAVYTSGDNQLVDDSVYYTYEKLKESFIGKLHKLFYVNADTKREDGNEFFHYKSADIYSEPSFDRFISLLREGLIMYDIRMGSYKTGSKVGKPHDHGSGFRIKEENITQLYGVHNHID